MQLEVIRNLEPIKALGRPVLVPIPRKQEDHRVAAYIAMALEYEADMIRVHDVAMACDLVALFDRRP
jgi:dihydropteroate synthase